MRRKPKFKAKVSGAAGDLVPRVAALEGRVKAALEGDLAKVKADVAALQAKVMHLIRGFPTLRWQGAKSSPASSSARIPAPPSSYAEMAQPKRLTSNS